ncbi:MAG: enolase C-terminal domain-like protein [Pseudomonadota bacterium]
MTVVRVEAAEFSERPVRLRLPFQFGSTEVRETAEAYCDITCVIGGREVTGRAAQLMVPRWFDKRPGLSNEDTIEELRETVRGACRAVRGMEGTAATLTRDLRAETRRALPSGTPDLASGFGPALVEMAVIDAICRAEDLPFWRAAQADRFGLIAHCPADLAPDILTASLSRIGPPARVSLRHTIGFDAPLTKDAVGADAPGDGLPVSLDEVVAATGINAFKIKLKGRPEDDLARLRAISGVIDRGEGYAVTLDANEQYAPDAFEDFLKAFQKDVRLKRMRSATRFVEQPFAREVALTEVGPVVSALPLVIDESDDTEDAFARALGLGWSGTSIKSCKGVLRALLNRARADAAGAILSGEDLTCQPGLCWQQDTAMAAACGVLDVERNGHHFGGGMQGAADAEIAESLDLHPDIYARIGGTVTLRIEAGAVRIGSLDRPGFAHAAKATRLV